MNNRGEDLPTFNDLNEKETEELLNRKIKEKESSIGKPFKEELKDKHDEWFKTSIRHNCIPPRQLKFFNQDRKISKGDVISWKVFPKLHYIGVRREHHVRYFKIINGIKTLPH
ncbi:hypothetical protein HanHA300_Chr16g0612721 [Helianthus annuus]|nr:hypothetical protein HanHA300_Chr16g0612721 [Helianthus annuus]KAJ0460657.1 hypothetical protein HanHA89_Chr16g0663321 [Helianthus annuus]